MLKQVAFGPRVPGSINHIRCRDWIADQLKLSCENVHFQELSHTWSQNHKSIKMWNVIGEQNWKDAKTRVVLFAHWDTRPMASQEEDEFKQRQPIPGANDGASGVAVLLELARVLKETRPDVGIQYVFTDGEDLGPGLDEMFLGARAYAKQLPSPRPAYGILLDMIGDKDLSVPMEPNSIGFAKDLVYALYAHAARVGLGGTFPMVEGPVIEDDHIPINQAGLKTVDLIDFTYPSWHLLSDTPDKCSPQSLGKVGKLLQTWLEQNPAYVPK
ncbi:peptidase M28 [Fimbriimonas ginsengisoli Gsoil 348]|uniref:Peptidase M28 n=1 Tax=Fimbriimonas ginsengisoli Gsoil 348 TaxID=661478 RepID=A0A068NX60_FIMGI|nr:peptidase M28 [Fimbriimonas ginsengisoli Gsoil 348]